MFVNSVGELVVEEKDLNMKPVLQPERHKLHFAFVTAFCETIFCWIFKKKKVSPEISFSLLKQKQR